MSGKIKETGKTLQRNEEAKAGPFRIIGLMSGTSLDGLDVACCDFSFSDKWNFSLVKAETIPYDVEWKRTLTNIHRSTAEDLARVHCAYGSLLGKSVKAFAAKHGLMPDMVSSHGHTVFHQPANGFTWQLGSGAHLAAASGFRVACNFRSQDVGLGGQGAPLVPIGDELLFSEMDYCLNLGGIANISFRDNGRRVAFDTCVCNQALNFLAVKAGLEYDKDGAMAASGRINNDLLKKLDEIVYYKRSYPKSLGREDVEKDVLPLIENEPRLKDAMATMCHHIARQIAIAMKDKGQRRRMLVTGGGAFNAFLVDQLRKESLAEIVIPERELIEFKEAVIFAFLGVLRLRGETNCLSSVTGANSDSCTGAVYEGVRSPETSD